MWQTWKNLFLVLNEVAISLWKTTISHSDWQACVMVIPKNGIQKCMVGSRFFSDDRELQHYYCFRWEIILWGTYNLVHSKILLTFQFGDANPDVFHNILDNISHLKNIRFLKFQVIFVYDICRTSGFRLGFKLPKLFSSTNP